MSEANTLIALALALSCHVMHLKKTAPSKSACPTCNRVWA